MQFEIQRHLGQGQYRNVVASGPADVIKLRGYLAGSTRRYRVTVLTLSNIQA